MHLPAIPHLAAAARSWSIESQQVSRRNAMLAATQCAQRRNERQDVAAYFAERATPPAPAAEPTVRTAQR